MTPKGKRWADVIRKELENSDSILCRAIQKLHVAKTLCRNHPKQYKLEFNKISNRSGNIEFTDYGYRSDLSPLSDVGYLFNK